MDHEPLYYVNGWTIGGTPESAGGHGDAVFLELEGSTPFRTRQAVCVVMTHAAALQLVTHMTAWLAQAHAAPRAAHAPGGGV